MSFDTERLYELLPVIFRIRDQELRQQRFTQQDIEDVEELRARLAKVKDQTSPEAEEIKEELNRKLGGPLRSMLSVIAEQAGAIEQSLSQLYDDQFAETCAPWALPYLGDLIGITGLPGANLKKLSPRAEVAHTIGYRRRKGTAAMFEQLARDVTGWPARAVEFFQLLCSTQYMNHLRPENQSFLSVRGADRLEYLGSAFEQSVIPGVASLTHRVDVRRIANGRGRYNIPNVGVFLYRLRALALTRSPAVPASAGDQRRFLFSPLGIDLPLFNLPETETEVTHLAEPINVPDRIKRRAMAGDFDSYYGKSMLLELADPDLGLEPEVIPARDQNDERQIIVCNLTDWINLPTNVIAIDPVLGRIAFPQDQTNQVLVSFHNGFSAEVGGGEYPRLSAFDTRQSEVLDANGTPIVNKVSNTFFKDAADHDVNFTTINDALAQLGPEGGAVEIVNSGRYAETLTLDATGKLIELRAADGSRPTVLLGADITITGGRNDEVVIDGLVIAGGALKVTGDLGRLTLRHCTLVPGISLLADGTPAQPQAASLVIDSDRTSVEIDHCITGAIVAEEDAEVHITNSIVDATDETNFAYTGTKDFGGPLRIENCTVIGMVRTGIMRLASNTIFLASFAAGADVKKLIAPVLAQRRQEGCVRFSYLSPGARVPPRFHCQPEKDDSLIRPRIQSLRFRDPEYCQLSPFGATEIRQGADDESEMGVFHDLFEPQREAHLRIRIDDYLRFGLDAGVFYAT
ncbi:MAG: hypothetical protein H7Z16_02620 [Pyrinomonadaceae bacterium]|nr:hypothetical protein [Pyrinomonadaceae bacterium]